MRTSIYLTDSQREHRKEIVARVESLLVAEGEGAPEYFFFECNSVFLVFAIEIDSRGCGLHDSSWGREVDRDWPILWEGEVLLGSCQYCKSMVRVRDTGVSLPSMNIYSSSV